MEEIQPEDGEPKFSSWTDELPWGFAGLVIEGAQEEKCPLADEVANKKPRLDRDWA